MRPKKEIFSEQPFYRAAKKTEVEELKKLIAFYNYKIEHTNPAALTIIENLQKQINTCKIKIDAINKGLDPMLAVGTAQGKIEPNLIRRTKSFR